MARRDPQWSGNITGVINRKALPGQFGATRGIETGTKPEWSWPENADASLDGGTYEHIPPLPIDIDLAPVGGPTVDGGPAGSMPWWDAKEDPYAPTGLYASMDPTYPWEDVGGLPVVGVYEGAVRSRGPVYPAFNQLEPSGGLWGDQALGRIMRFPANVPMRDDPYNEGVWLGDYKDDLGSAVINNSAGEIPEEDYTASLLGWTGGYG